MNKEFLTYFTGTFLAILSAGIIWLLKGAYNKHKEEMLALARYERLFVINSTLLKDNFDFVDKWLETAEKNRFFSFRFRNYNINNEYTFKLNNLDLIKEILSINYKLESTSLDFENFYKSYWETIIKIDSINNKEEKEKNLEAYNLTVRESLEEIKKNYEPLYNDILNVIVLIRASSKVRRHSLFGYLNILNKDIFPVVNKKALKKQREILDKNLERLKE